MNITVSQLKQKYFDFFIKKNHRLIPSASLVPENDPTVLFTTAGMHPLVPYLMGEPHPLGKRLVSVQKCLRTDDIDNVGDGFHHTFFEMLGNWSLGDYWKKEAINWSHEFLIRQLDLEPARISVTCFAGDKDAPRDDESAEIWRKLGIPKQRIYFLGKKDNWWGPVGETGPCGPDSEIFYDTGKTKCRSNCDVTCQCGKYVEIWNDVFMQFNKNKDGSYLPLQQKNVDTGMGVDRVTAIINGYGDDDYRTGQFKPIIESIAALSARKYQSEDRKAMRIIADHLRAASFLIADDVEPSNHQQGYILRRLIRRAIRYGRLLGIEQQFCTIITDKIITLYGDDYKELKTKQSLLKQQLDTEEMRFSRTLDRGLKEIAKLPHIDGKAAFNLFQTYGFPLELTLELAAQKGQSVDRDQFQNEFSKHQQLSRTAAKGLFKGGLGGQTEIFRKYHTATHLLHQALRQVLGNHVRQVGSNITPDRARFDFTHPQKLTPAQIAQTESIINSQIEANLPVKMDIMSLSKARNSGALAYFDEKYGQKVKVYSIGAFSKEVCGGPHVGFTGEIGGVKIEKEEAVGSGKRRLYLSLK